MRPLFLKIEAFGPFVEKQEIDFSKYEDFFLITGKTGSGKTTIFDAIKFALYGLTSGTRSSKNIVALQKKETSTPKVIFSFLLKGKEYKIIRIPPHQRPAKRGSPKLVEVETSLELYLKKNKTWEPFEGTLSSLNKKINELIHLTAEEFSKIVLLPQGEFQKFLESDSKEKRLILEKLFPTKEHDFLAQKVKEQKNEKKFELNKKKEELNLLRKKFDPDSSLEKIQALSFQIEKVNLSLLKEQKLLNQLNEKLGQAKEIDKLFTEHQKAQKELTFLNSQKEVIKKKKELLQKAKEAKELMPFFNNLKKTEKELKTLTAKKAFLLKKREEESKEKNKQELLAKNIPLLETEIKEKTLFLGKLEVFLPQEKDLAQKKNETLLLNKEKQNLEKNLSLSEKTLKDLAEKQIFRKKDLLKETALVEKLLQQERDEQQEKEKFLISFLGHSLQAGKPCPVCGSLEHPQPTSLKNSKIETEKKLEKIKKDLTLLQKRIKEKTLLFEEQEKEQKILEEQIQKQKQKIVIQEEKTKALVKNIKELEKKLTPFPNLGKKIEELKINLQQKKTFLENFFLSLNQAKLNLTGTEKSLEIISQNHDSCLKSHSGLEKELAEKISLSSLEKNQDLLSFFLSEKDFLFLEKEIEDFKTKKNSLEKIVSFLEKKLENQKAPALSSLKEELTKKINLLKEIEKEQKSLEEQKKDLLFLREEDASLNKKIKALLEESMVLTELADELNGRNSKNLTFQSFILNAYLQEITKYASLRLQKMSNSRYTLFVNEDIFHGSKEAGLELDVFDAFSGKKRSVKTLSGGEKFLASISLALGLSDVIQAKAGEIELDSLFIDEGFGSLDSSTLDQALTILDDLRSNRMVGIISHVEELKLRIPSQIKVIKKETGSLLQQH